MMEQNRLQTATFWLGLTGSDFDFAQVPIRFKGDGTTAYTKWIDIGMPSVPKRFLDCVVYLYADRDSAVEGQDAGGCGFIVGVRSKVHPNAACLYVISNYHVVKKGGFSFVRVNKRDGGVSIIALDPSDWEHLPNGGDVAAARFEGIEDGPGAYLCVTDEVFLRKDECGKLLGLGDDVLMVGRFIDHDGGVTNKPALRFGNISIEPTAVAWENSNDAVEYFCLDMHSRTGFSGAPVFAYRTPGSDLANVLTEDGKLRDTVVLTSRETRMKLLGIHCGQFPEKMDLELPDGNGKGQVAGYSGMTVALPAWSILDLLNCPKFVHERNKIDAQWKGKNFACPE